MSNEQLPSFASQWVQQWKQAAPRLQAIRDEELRRLDGKRAARSQVSRAESIIFERYPERNGMVIMQRWFMRRQLLSRTKPQQSPH
ncbi:hypothetical protein [Neorhodopirellula pilleata]|uniref:Uncharacterized protein n=1 Tax=Neorhodopirellula pilleata TaxID=2714738 RepID=A0A5C6AA68_9BACT|nr:hypothetical protein [Neorhodopirellula pilleata]TWT96257.1 hypothetical protein Pla100_27340 [Neorhodopirellula pilleata]